MAKGNLTSNVHATWNQACSAIVNLMCSITDERVAVRKR